VLPRIAARVQCLLRRRSSCMPLITAFNLRKEDRLPDIENALRRALVSMAELKINDDEIDFVPVLTPDGFHGQVTRINVDLWEGSHRTKEALQSSAPFSPLDVVTAGPMFGTLVSRKAPMWEQWNQSCHRRDECRWLSVGGRKHASLFL
jgi:hypothetical protein